MASKGQRGFTLVELLVVIGIIATLAAVAIPSVGRFVRPGRDAAADQEYARVQAAMDTYIAENVLSQPAVTENLVAVSDFSSTDPVLYPAYIREPNTLCAYTWDDSGQINQANCP